MLGGTFADEPAQGDLWLLTGDTGNFPLRFTGEAVGGLPPEDYRTRVFRDYNDMRKFAAKLEQAVIDYDVCFPLLFSCCFFVFPAFPYLDDSPPVLLVQQTHAILERDRTPEQIEKHAAANKLMKEGKQVYCLRGCSVIWSGVFLAFLLFFFIYLFLFFSFCLCLLL
jgi:hypothetical protein